jgi:hypothetical protein
MNQQNFDTSSILKKKKKFKKGFVANHPVKKVIRQLLKNFKMVHTPLLGRPKPKLVIGVAACLFRVGIGRKNLA